MCGEVRRGAYGLALQAWEDLLGEKRQLVQVIHEVQDQAVEADFVEADELGGDVVGGTYGAIGASGQNLTSDGAFAGTTVDAFVVGTPAGVAGVQVGQVAQGS